MFFIESISGLDITFSILFNLLLVNKAIFLCFVFFFCPICLRKILTTSLPIRNTKLIIVFAIRTVARMTVVNDQRETLLLSFDKTFLLIFSFAIDFGNKKYFISFILLSLNSRRSSNLMSQTYASLMIMLYFEKKNLVSLYHSFKNYVEKIDS